MLKRQRRFFLTGLPVALTLVLGGCGLFQPQEPPPDQPTTQGVYILCEGNFGASNASLWHLPADFDSVTANVYQQLTGDPLGDTGQSLLVDGDRLYIMVNASSTVEVLDLSGDTLRFVQSVDLLGAGPREMAVVGTRGYVTAWNVPGILVLDLSTLAVSDTIHLAALPEDILVHDGSLYVALPLKADWSIHDRVLRIDPASGAVVDSYTVGGGPQQLLVKGGQLFVSRQWLDESFSSFRGIAAVDLATDSVTVADWGSGSGVDIFTLSGKVYVATGTGVAPVKDDLGLNLTGILGGSLTTTYAAATDGAHIFIGSYADFSTPGEVAVYDSTGTLVTTVTVGLGPGSFAFVAGQP